MPFHDGVNKGRGKNTNHLIKRFKVCDIGATFGTNHILSLYKIQATGVTVTQMSTRQSRALSLMRQAYDARQLVVTLGFVRLGAYVW